MGIDVWIVDKTDTEGYSTFVDLCEDFDEAVEAVFLDWSEGDGHARWHTWLSEIEDNEYEPKLEFYIYEFQPASRMSYRSYTYYIHHFVKGDNSNGNQ